MTIFIDPSEAREGTRLPDTVIKQSIVLPGLEAMTGADLLVSILSQPKLSELNETLPNKLALRKHLEHGLLIQRKSGLDLVNSIPNDGLSDKLVRMQQWSHRCWLMTVGILSSRAGEAFIDGRGTAYSYNQVIGAILKWQSRGGYYINVPSDSQIAPTINRLLEHLREFEQQPIKRVRVPEQQLFRPSGIDAISHLRIGVGIDKLTLLEQSCGTLADMLVYLSDYDSIEQCHVEGIGKGIVANFKRVVGLRENEVLVREFKNSDE